MYNSIKFLFFLSLMLLQAQAEFRYTPEGYFESKCSQNYKNGSSDYKMCSFCGKYGAVIYTMKGRWATLHDANKIVKYRSDRIPCRKGIQIFLKYQHQYYNRYDDVAVRLHNKDFREYKNRAPKKSNLLYVCYDSKSFDYNDNVTYMGCKRSSIPCKRNKKRHFGKYPNNSKALQALGRCQKSNPRFTD